MPLPALDSEFSLDVKNDPGAGVRVPLRTGGGIEGLHINDGLGVATLTRTHLVTTAQFSTGADMRKAAALVFSAGSVF